MMELPSFMPMLMMVVMVCFMEFNVPPTPKRIWRRLVMVVVIISLIL